MSIDVLHNKRDQKIVGIAAIAAAVVAVGILVADGHAGDDSVPGMGSNRTETAATTSPVDAKTQQVNAKYASLVKKLSHGSLRLVSTFAGPDGLTGLVAQPVSGQGQKTLAWGLAGQLLIPGPVLNAQGQNLSLQAAQAHGLLPKPMAGTKLAQAMLSAPGFTVGTKGPLFAVFLDPNCIFCHKFWGKAYPFAEAGKIRFKVVPVGFLKPTSLSKAATILMQNDPAAAWAANEAKFDAATEEGGTVPAKTLDPKIVQEIQSNTQLLAKTGEVATPTIAACVNAEEKAPQVFHGMAPGMLADLAKGRSITSDGGCA